jgi:hypothetical protein
MLNKYVPVRTVDCHARSALSSYETPVWCLDRPNRHCIFLPPLTLQKIKTANARALADDDDKFYALQPALACLLVVVHANGALECRVKATTHDDGGIKGTLLVVVDR